jgi:hypothetical protein
LKSNNLAEQEKAIVYNELVANAVAAQTVNDLTHALNKLHDRGVNIAAEDLAHFSPYPTSKVKRFGDYAAQVRDEGSSAPPTINPAGGGRPSLWAAKRSA